MRRMCGGGENMKFFLKLKSIFKTRATMLPVKG